MKFDKYGIYVPIKCNMPRWMEIVHQLEDDRRERWSIMKNAMEHK